MLLVVVTSNALAYRPHTLKPMGKQFLVEGIKCIIWYIFEKVLEYRCSRSVIQHHQWIFLGRDVVTFHFLENPFKEQAYILFNLQYLKAYV
jgi:hypothetical protein